jgi:uncharacterized membrane protein YeaQ/YmgE (transglycosylase-associated protein family)
VEILWLIVVGAIVGVIARFLVPGRDPMGWVGTIVLGIVGSFLGGIVASLIADGEIVLRTAGWIGSILGAIVVLLIYRAVQGRRTTV